MPPANGASESFGGLVQQLRARLGLTQRELAAQLGLHTHSVQGWEAGSSYPGPASLQVLTAAFLRAGAFTAGREAAEAAALWAVARREAPRLRAQFDHTWFDALPGPSLQPARAAVGPASPDPTPHLPRRQFWGEAPDVAPFVGRQTERELLQRWALDQRCRVVALFGLGGIGKTLLAARLARDLAPSFDTVIWRSLLNAPTPADYLAATIGFLAPAGPADRDGEAASLRRLLELLRETRCLLVLDNFETVIQPGGRGGEYRPGYERYGALLQQLAETPHQSCLLLTSREEPLELAPLRAEHGPVRALDLGGLGADDGRALLRDKQLDGDSAAWQVLVARYGGNGLALKMVAETVRELFDGDIAAFLEYAAPSAGLLVGEVSQLLASQVQRLSALEQELLRWLAVEREPVDLTGLGAELGALFGRGAVLGALAGLRQRSLLETGAGRSTFALQSVVLEYTTDHLIDELAQELVLATPELLCRLPIVKATANEHVRLSQERLIATPLLARLVAAQAGPLAAAAQLRGVGSSRVDLQACKLEYSIVSPK